MISIILKGIQLLIFYINKKDVSTRRPKFAETSYNE